MQIKNFLLGDFNYNSFQKEVLATIFKKKINCLGVYKEHRGLSTIIRTIGLFYKNTGKKVLCVSQEILPKKVLACVDISDKYIDGYDFYIWLNPKGEEFKVYDRYAVFSKEKIEGSQDVIEDNFEIPSNVAIVSSEEIFSKGKGFIKYLPLAKKKEVIKKLSTIDLLYATEDIYPYL